MTISAGCRWVLGDVFTEELVSELDGVRLLG
jgi:hypothetical protein